MKKIIASLTLLSLVVMLAGPSFAVAATVSTGLTQDTSGGANPIVKAKWEANVDKYTDDATTAGAQFNPSGQKDVSKTIALCAVVTDPDGLADIDAVYADVFYPDGIALGDHHVPLHDQSGEGCGALMQEDTLTKLPKADGIALFCDQVRNNNNNLPTFNTDYNYDEICGETGELQKDTAAVFCGQKDISYEDPSGSYEVWAVAQDKNGLQDVLENHFTYLPLTAFETDFNQINYGNVRLNTHKIISGDKTWNALNQGKASVRNVGNTRLKMRVMQDDMGLGKTDGNWNVKYDARVGSSAGYANYWPEATPTLNDPLDLSELDEMDFSIDISKFPPTHTGPYTGTMTLTASSVAHLVCATQPVAPTIDGVISSGEYDNALSMLITNAGGGTVKAKTMGGYLYLAADIITDTTDNRTFSGFNDEFGVNLGESPVTDTVFLGLGSTNANGRTVGTIDGYFTNFATAGHTLIALFTSGHRVIEWKIPLTAIPS
ncbi:MAG: hypothetical protein Q8O88_04420, partial [bacterium]|nr:hypothetical protein [bacterium]